MAQQSCKRLALAAALVSLGIGLGALAQPTPSTTPGKGGPTPSTATTGGPTPSTSKSGGPTPGSGTTTDSKASAKAGKSGSLDAGDRKFVETTARDGMAEVQLGQMAQQKAQNAQVKEFAARMVTDHGKANDELKTLASSKGVQLPSETDKAHKSKADSLGKKAADKFDHEYMEEMVKDHKKDVKEFEKQSKNAKDADVRAFASKTLPTLQEHLKMAEAAQKAAKGGGKAAAPAK
jgi:putative membrane protein